MATKAKSSACHDEKHVHQPHKANLRRRMSRILGQTQGIANMIEEDRYCVDILVQVSAVRSALNQVAMQIVEDHTKGCVQKAQTRGKRGRGDSRIDGGFAEINQVIPNDRKCSYRRFNFGTAICTKKASMH